MYLRGVSGKRRYQHCSALPHTTLGGHFGGEHREEWEKKEGRELRGKGRGQKGTRATHSLCLASYRYAPPPLLLPMRS
jgi:hypothetical protein